MKNKIYIEFFPIIHLFFPQINCKKNCISSNDCDFYCGFKFKLKLKNRETYFSMNNYF